MRALHSFCLFSFAEVFFVYAAEGANEIFGKIFELRAGFDTIIGVAHSFIVFPTANIAYVFHD